MQFECVGAVSNVYVNVVYDRIGPNGQCEWWLIAIIALV